MHDDLKNALNVLYKGGIILYPTDTIWGIGCDATNANAVKRIYDLKQRADSKSMLILIDNDAKLNSYLSEVPEIAYDLIDLADKPLTIIYDGAKNLAHNLIAEDGSIGIRITNEPFSKQLCNQFKKPIVSTSANISGQSSPGHFGEISNNIISAVDYVVTYRQDETTIAKPSGIIKLGVNGEIKVIRQ
ncbi:MAG: threonylcarbamoyl-AMP synthase [Marinilabiliaceae bacterium]|nr:threonylcarbamoyl-AMP synthase [Marinilabiliaceae bacterium]